MNALNKRNGNINWLYKNIKNKINLESLSKIGQGGYGEVYQTINGNIVKIIKHNGASEKKMVMNEYKKNKNLQVFNVNHETSFLNDIKDEITYQQHVYKTIKGIDGLPITPKILQGGIFRYNNTLYGVIIMSKIIGIDIDTFIKTYKFNKPLLQSIKGQIYRILNILHNNHIAHNDMSSKNIYITENGIVKILDWGSATPNYLSQYFFSKRYINNLPVKKRINAATYRQIKKINNLLH